MKKSNELTTGKYYPEINIARGILVVLVVLGHVVTQVDFSAGGGYEAAAFSVLGSVIYSFHMPAFFFISGFVSAKIICYTSLSEKREYVKKRVSRLLIPYFVMGIVYLPAKLFMSGAARNEYQIKDIWRIFIGENPDGALWFLYVLFFISIITCLLVSTKNLQMFLFLAFALCLISSFFTYPADVLDKLGEYPFYFLLGIFIRYRYDEKVQNKLESTRSLVLAIIIFALSNIALYQTDFYCIKIITALTGIIIVLSLSKKISERADKHKYKLFDEFGNYSMDIYIFSEPVKVVVRTVLKNTYVIINAVACFLLGVLVPIVLSYLIIRRFRILKRLFLGIE